MLPGPSMIKKCSECSQLVIEHTVASGNTFGAKFWTDGKREAPMLPDSLWLVKCPHCQTLVWLADLEEVNQVEPMDYSTLNEKAQPCITPEFDDYLTEIDKNILGNYKERYLRFRIWWAGNDQRRNVSHISPLSDSEKGNLRALYMILNESDDNDRLSMAEIRRELGQFSEAEALLNKPFPNDFTQAVLLIRNLIQKQDVVVSEMKFDE